MFFLSHISCNTFNFHYIYNAGCPSPKFGLDCSQDCPVCYAGGVCHDVTGECVCRPGFQGSQCQTRKQNNYFVLFMLR